MGFFLLIQSLARHRFAWVMLLLLGIFLEGFGLYLQYGSPRLQPSVNCVYERAALLSFVVSGLLGFLCPSNILIRLLATLIFLMGSAAGIFFAFDQLTYAYQTTIAGFGSGCQTVANFPYVKLDQLLPWMFSPVADCTPVAWDLMGFNLSEWAFFIFTVGFVVAVFFIISEFFRRKRRDYADFYR